MRVKQKNLRVFHIEIENIDDFICYYNKNRVLLKEFFLLIEGKKSEEVEALFRADGVCFKYIDDCNLKLLHVKKEIEVEEKSEQKVEKTLFEEPKKEEEKFLEIFNRPIRSGEEINSDLPVSVFGRINSGAKLFCTQSLSVFGEIDGLVQCDGEYILCMGISARGHVIFNGEIIDKEMIKSGVLQKISMKEGRALVKEII